MTKRVNKVLLFVNIVLALALIVAVLIAKSYRSGLAHQLVEGSNGSKHYNIILSDFSLLRIGINQSGGLKYVSSFPDERELIISYFPNGNVKSKLYFDDEYQIQGYGYYFYEKSGDLEGIYFFNNGVANGTAVEYHDSANLIKHIIYYNDLGEMYYRKTFDGYGNLVQEEGSKYHDPQEEQ